MILFVQALGGLWGTWKDGTATVWSFPEKYRGICHLPLVIVICKADGCPCTSDCRSLRVYLAGPSDALALCSSVAGAGCSTAWVAE